MELMTGSNQGNGVAVVTGATGGMGSATAREMAGQGWSLILCDLDADRLEGVAGPLREGDRSVEILAADCSDKAFPGQLIEKLSGRPIGALVHTAGLSPTMADAARILAVNYDASVRLTDAVLPHMARGACAVLIASSSGYDARELGFDDRITALGASDDSSPLLEIATNSGFAYMLSKRGVQMLVERMSPAFGVRGARIMSISPGLIDTAMGRAEQKAHPQMDVMLQKTPLGRYGSGEEIATVAAFLCSQAASFVSGSDIKVDGGVLAVLFGAAK
jgi:NAD(P)-dependent dehydrogenase (short-subunit alcohol dehydrogenase family)